MVEDAAVLAATPPPLEQEAQEYEAGQQSHTDDGSNDNAGNSTAGQAIAASGDGGGIAARGGTGSRRHGRGETHGRRNGRQRDVGTATGHVRAVAASVGRIDTAGRTVRAQPDRAVGIPAVAWLIRNALYASITRQGVGGQGTVGEVGPNLRLRAAARVRAESAIGCDVRFTLGKLRLQWGSAFFGYFERASNTYACLGTDWPRLVCSEAAVTDRVLDYSITYYGGSEAGIKLSGVGEAYASAS